MMRWFRLLVLASATVACAHQVQVIKRGEMAPGNEIAVVDFRDCTIADQADCGGSGQVASGIFARVLSLRSRFKAMPLGRPVAATAQLSDQQAVTLAKKAGFRYVMNGEVTDYYSVSPMPFVQRQDRAALSVRVLDVQTGAVVAFFTDHDDAQAYSSPQEILEDMAEDVAKKL